MASKAGWQVRDYGGEIGTIGARGVDVTAANFDAQEALRAALETAIDGITIGVIATRSLKTLDEVVSAAKPASQYAQRESKYLVRYTGADGKTYTAEVPCADLTLLSSGTQFMDISAGSGLAFVTAWENYVVDEQGGAVTVLNVQQVGRNI
jgi:hypothetical protein